MWLHCLVVKSITKWWCPVSWFGWMENSYKLHIYVTTIATWCHVLSFAIRILCNLSKVTRPCHMTHMVITTKNKLLIQLFIYKFLVVLVNVLNVPNTQITKKNNKRIGLSLNSKHKTKEPQKKRKAKTKTQSVQDQSTNKFLFQWSIKM